MSTTAQPSPHESSDSCASAALRLRAVLACYSGCDEEYPIDEVRYDCARCGGLLDVRHDMEALRRVPGALWRERFERRGPAARSPYQSGVWSKKEWICPDIDDEDVVSLCEGWTPLLPMPELAAQLGLEALYIKQCGHSHTGSFKDLGMTVLVSMVRHMRRQGLSIPALACASTGDTSAALAAYAARASLPAIVFLPAGKISEEQLTQPLASGARVLALDTDFDGCMRLVARFCREHGVYLANSMNPLRMEGQKSLSVEIAQQLSWQVPDFLVVPGGNLGNVTAIGKGFGMMVELGLTGCAPRLVVAQAAHANPLARAFRRGFAYEPLTAKSTLASAIQIGAPVNVHKAIATLKACDGIVEDATEEELTGACLRGDAHGLYTDPHTGVALAVLMKLVRAGTIPKGARVVVVSTAHGLKFSAQKRAYQPAAPLMLPADLGAVEAALLPWIAERAAL